MQPHLVLLFRIAKASLIQNKVHPIKPKNLISKISFKLPVFMIITNLYSDMNVKIQATE
ncbi:hypothetical protein GCM10017161_36220 [Thalassotalea marina]|uniref:Uncharacterized protein n=1 Tax=Thalassotalea marina TaxID=1673741 RepID=A0A919BNZ6_9GAMM|nr:hypothetical protein GCM10017161_36220 [Thalassotalea marina]